MSEPIDQHFSIGEICWHVLWRERIKIAGPLELFTNSMRGYRAIRFISGASGKAWPAQPAYLRKIDRKRGNWDDVKDIAGWKPKELRA